MGEYFIPQYVWYSSKYMDKNIKMNSPLVSVILSTYNGSKYIIESIDSVLRQSYKFFEFIIINDCSSDNTEQVILEYQKNDKRVIYLKNKKNLWLTSSLNRWLSQARGEYIARIDDDDIWMLDKLEKQILFMEKNLDYWLCGTSTIVIDQNGEEIKRTLMRYSNIEIKDNLLKSNQFTHSSIIMRRSILEEVWYYSKIYNGAEDYELWLRIWQISKLYNIVQYLTKYRWLKTSISREKWLNQETLTLKIMCKYRKDYPNFYTSLLLRIGYFMLKLFKIIK